MKEKKTSETPEKPKVGYPHGAFDRSGRWISNGKGDALVAGVNRDLIRRRREGGSPQDFVIWLSKYPLSAEATKMLGTGLLQRMSDLEHADDWSTLTMWARTDFGAWLQRCGRPLLNHHWNDAGQWVPKP